jgi:hypothetical protein
MNSSNAPEPNKTPNMIKMNPEICGRVIFSPRKITAPTNAKKGVRLINIAASETPT